MRNVRMTIWVMVAGVMAVVNMVPAESIRGIDMDFVTIGNPGNVADGTVEHDGTIGYGAVAYEYRIGKYEITNTQWNDFITLSGGVPTGNPSDAYDEGAIYTDAMQPANNISYYEVAQFCNYLTSGDKSKGVYQFNGTNVNPGDLVGINRDTAQSLYGKIFYLPSDQEWYKAAYYMPDGSGYSLYANGTDVAPTAGVDTNYQQDYPYDEGPWEAGTGTIEQNDTFDMMGNVSEWVEVPVSAFPHSGGGYVRGGSFHHQDATDIQSPDSIANMVNTYELYSIGSRIASVPEPTTLLLLGLGGLMLRRKR